MTATNIILCFQSGKVLTAYVPDSAAVDTYLPLNKNGMATSGSPDEVKFDESDVITDVFFSATSGGVEIMKNDNQTSRMLFAQTNQASNAGRKHHTIGIVAGASYRLRVCQAF